METMIIHLLSTAYIVTSWIFVSLPVTLAVIGVAIMVCEHRESKQG